MVYRKATYEEYLKASEFARFRYRFGVFVQAIAVILFLFILIYTVTNIEEMKANPKDYAEETLGVICNPPIIYQEVIEQNWSTRNTRNIREG
ncbi:unnamed protein product [marine sediment metagenome]|uniref:Uncharacterized protein n=1 Tax=marine sediment metagenome TaxID=412755 RepID=X0UJM5_9ZZZZ